jgi:hypothetical protein
MQSMKPSGGKNNSLLLLTRYCKNRTRKWKNWNDLPFGLLSRACRFHKQTGVRGWEVVEEEWLVKRFLSASVTQWKCQHQKSGEEGREPSSLSSEALLGGIGHDKLTHSFARQLPLKGLPNEWVVNRHFRPHFWNGTLCSPIVTLKPNDNRS